MKKEIINNLLFLKNLVINNKRVFYVVLIVFALGFITGFILPDSIKLIIFNSITDQFSKFDNNGSNAKAFQEIFLNNLQVSFTTLILGITIIIPLIILFFSASLPIGILYDFINRLSALNLITNGSTNFALSILPHGIIELGTAVFETFMAVLIGLKILFTKRIEPNLSRKKFLFKIIKSYIFIIIPLLIIAALIESYVSGPLTKTLFSETIKKDLTLNSFVINQDEINKLGVSSEDKKEDLNKIKNDFMFKQTITFLYNKEIFEMLKKTKKPIHTISKSYLINKKNYFDITISQFSSTQEIEEQNKLSKKVYELLGEKTGFEKNNMELSDNKFTIISLGDGLYIANYSNKTVYLKSYKINNYLLTASFIGDNLELFYKLIDLEIRKIVKEK